MMAMMRMHQSQASHLKQAKNHINTVFKPVSGIDYLINSGRIGSSLGKRITSFAGDESIPALNKERLKRN